MRILPLTMKTEIDSLTFMYIYSTFNSAESDSLQLPAFLSLPPPRNIELGQAPAPPKHETTHRGRYG